MAAVLQYDIATVGLDKIHRMTRSVEAELRAHASRVSRIGLPGERGSSMAARRSSGASVVSQERRQQAAAARAAITAEKKVARERLAEEKRVNAQVLRERVRTIQAAERKEISAAKAAARARKSFAHGVTRSVGGATRGVLGMGAGILGMAGGVAAADAVHAQVGLDARLRQTIIAARGPGEKGAYTPQDLMGRVTSTALSTGTKREDIAAGIGSFVQKTGDIKTAVENMKTFATIAKATGATVEDVAGAAADLSQKFDLKKPKDMADALSALAFQGKRGAFELKDMASQFPRLAAAARTFGYKGAGGVRELGGFAQIAMQGTGSPEAATTAIENVFMQMKKNAKRIQSGAMFGGRKVQVFEGGDPTHSARRTRDIVTDALVASHGNQTQLLNAFGARGSRAIAPLQAAFSTAYNKAGGGKKGEAAGRVAVEKMWKDAIEGAGDFKDMTKDAADAGKSMASKLQNVKTKMEDTLGRALLPALTTFADALEKNEPEIEKVVKAFGAFAAWMAKNPIKGIGALILASVAKDVAGAGIGAAVKAAILAALHGGAPASGGAGVVRTVAGAAGAAGAVAGAGALTIAGAESYQRAHPEIYKPAQLNNHTQLISRGNMTGMGAFTPGHVSKTDMSGGGVIGRAIDAAKGSPEGKAIASAGSNINQAADKFSAAVDRMPKGAVASRTDPIVRR